MWIELVPSEAMKIITEAQKWTTAPAVHIFIRNISLHWRYIKTLLVHEN
jgi:hypothetical protein